ncbi:hypothetical protein A1O1_00040 [Capronia coronata CBS 617.96]|uniref:Uncharacterized protein n=1 Tax=Capronia coronata CBS 617.96 TaxID=1182541 RepID=W9YPU1_9EURO|nr:uncharacterized protein A1O1_00040 [Capronia coronata CBS 617.96]EXJ94922.1 hypothetical protein A1O1_00040 [Capronia coronata CBS 617.96]
MEKPKVVSDPTEKPKAVLDLTESPKAILDAPHRFVYRDWVIDIAIPPIRTDIPEAIALQEYSDECTNRMLGIVGARLGKGRCFYSFLAEGTGETKRRGQIEVTHLYAFHQVKHWPGASEQMDWTSFVMAKIEYDNLRNLPRQHESSENIMLPVLPVTTVSILKEVINAQDQDLLRICAVTGTLVSHIVAGEVCLYAIGPRVPAFRTDPATPPKTPKQPLVPSQILPQNATANALVAPSRAGPSQQNTIVDQGIPIDPLIIAASAALKRDTPQALHVFGNLTIQQIVESEKSMRQFTYLHRRWLSAAYWVLLEAMTRHMFRLIVMNDASIIECDRQARYHMQTQAKHNLQQWLEKHPELSLPKSEMVGSWQAKQLKSLLLVVIYHKPIPPTFPAEKQPREVRKRYVSAMARQRHILATWIATARDIVNFRRGRRYRNDKDMVMDMWTGVVWYRSSPGWEIKRPLMSPEAVLNLETQPIVALTDDSARMVTNMLSRLGNTDDLASVVAELNSLMANTATAGMLPPPMTTMNNNAGPGTNVFMAAGNQPQLATGMGIDKGKGKAVNTSAKTKLSNQCAIADNDPTAAMKWIMDMPMQKVALEDADIPPLEFDQPDLQLPRGFGLDEQMSVVNAAGLAARA